MALSISRRSFMKCVGITAFATATGTLMTGCSQGPVMGDFGGSFPLYELNEANPLLNITLTGLDWSPFDITLGQIADEVDIDLPFSELNLSFISSILGYGCAMPKGLIKNESDKTMIVLPYFTGDLLDQAFNEFVRPMIKSNQGTIKKSLETLLYDNSDALAKKLDQLIQDKAAETGSWLKVLVTAAQTVDFSKVISSSNMKTFLTNGEEDLVKKLPRWAQIALRVIGIKQIYIPPVRDWDFLRDPLMNEIRGLIDTYLPQVTDIFRLLMVQGIFDGKLNESKTDQLLNAAAAGYSRYKAQKSFMLDIINPRSPAAGVLGIPAKQNWFSMELMFSTKKLNLSLAENYPLDWETGVCPLAVEAVLFMLYKNSGYTADHLAGPLCDVILPLVDNLQISLSNEGGQVGLSFQNNPSIL